MTAHSQIPDYARAREVMVDSQLRPEGVNDPAVVAAMRKVPRERFVPEESRPLAYSDRAVPLGGGRFLTPSTALGLLLTQLAPRRGESALIVGAATGYSAAILREIGLQVAAVEADESLAWQAREQGVDVIESRLEEGHDEGGPFDLMLIDGAVDHIPDVLLSQLKEGGRFGAALVERGVTRLIVGRKAGGSYGQYSIADAAVPPLPGFSRPRTFTF